MLRGLLFFSLCLLPAGLSGCLDPLRVELPTDQGVDAGDLGSLDLGPSDGALDLGLDADIPADADVDAGLTAILEVGFGSTADFMVAPGSGSAMAVMGVQGGYHLDMGFRIRGFTAEDFNSGDWIVRYAFRQHGGRPKRAHLAGPLAHGHHV